MCAWGSFEVVWLILLCAFMPVPFCIFSRLLFSRKRCAVGFFCWEFPYSRNCSICCKGGLKSFNNLCWCPGWWISEVDRCGLLNVMICDMLPVFAHPALLHSLLCLFLGQSGPTLSFFVRRVVVPLVFFVPAMVVVLYSIVRAAVILPTH